MLKNPRHESFAQAYALNGNAAEAYRSAGYSPKDADANAARLMVNDSIKARIESIRAEASGKSSLSKEQALEFLAQIILTPAGKVGKNDPLCQEYTDRATEHGSELKIKMPGKLEALKLLGQWCGWEKGTEAENKAADGLAEVMARIRSRQ